MRTLKKALCLVLVLAMVFTLAVPALAVDKASEFTDYADVQNKEAVDVLVALDVISGNPDGTFDADGTFTRAQAATMISYLTLGKTIADALPATSTEFTDVPSTHWAAKYIQYCVGEGLLSGYGDGKFGPNDELTAPAWGLMLARALGYVPANEGIGGTGWEIPATKLAMKAGIATADDLAAATLTRDTAAKMALNTLSATMVEYEVGGTTITTGDVTITTAASAAEPVLKAGTSYGDYTTDTTSDGKEATVEFCERYFPNLNKTAVEAKVNGGLAGNYWFLNKDKTGGYNAAVDTKIGTYATESVTATFAGGTKYVDVAKALGVQNNASLSYTIENYTNGTPDSTQTGTVTGASIYTNYAATTIPAGVTVDAVVTADGTIRLIVNVYYLGVISYGDAHKDTNTDDVDDRYVEVERYVNGAATSPVVNYTLTAKNCTAFEDIYAAASALTSGQNLYYVIQPEGDEDDSTTKMLTINEAASITGKMTAKTATTYTINGTAYKLSATAASLSIGATGDFTTAAVYYLDNSGNILYKTATPGAVANYAFIEDIQVYPKTVTGLADTAGYYMQAKLVMPDGSVKIVDVDSVKLHGNSNTYSISGATGTVKIVSDNVTTVNDLADTRVHCAMTYTVNDDGTYNLVEGNTAWAASGAIAAVPNFAGSLVAYDNTTFIVRTGAGTAADPYTYNVYTGYASLPVSATNTLTATVYGNVTGNIYYLVGTSGTAAGNAQYVYITSTDYTYNYVNGSTKDTYVFKAIVDGVETTVTANSTTATTLDDTVGMYQVKYTDGVITSVENNGAALTGTYVSTVAKNGTVYIAGSAKAYNDSTKVYIIDATTSVVKTAAMTDILAGTSSDTNVYVQYVKAADGTTDTATISVIYAVQ